MKLGKTQEKILRLLSDRVSYPEIIARLGISPANLHTQCHHIRMKTGIKSTKDAQECRNFFRQRGMEKGKGQRICTDTQIKIFRMHVSLMTHTQIAVALSISPSTVANHITQACARLGITNLGHGRTTAIRAYLERLEVGEGKVGGSPMEDPLF